MGVLENFTGILAGTVPQKLSSVLYNLDMLFYESINFPVLSSSVIPSLKSRQKRSDKRKTSILDVMGKILGMEMGEIGRVNGDTKLVELGMDSLMRSGS